MKRSKWLYVTVIFVILIVSLPVDNAVASQPFTQIRFTSIYPQDINSLQGLDVSMGREFNEKVLVGFSCGLIREQHTDQTSVYDYWDGDGSYWKSTRKYVESTMFILPLMVSVDIKIPLEDLPIRPFIGWGLGYQVLLNKEKNLEDDVSATRTYGGFAFQANLGWEFQPSPQVALSAALLYNYCKLYRNNDIDLNLPRAHTVDIRGFGARAGITILGFGII
jgi:hypothetical protein